MCAYLALGWTISGMGIVQLPIWAAYAIFKQKGSTFGEKFRSAFKPQTNWGPKNPELFERYQKYVTSYEDQQRLLPRGNLLVRFRRHVFG